MAYIQPDATILICQDVPLNASYDDTLTFYDENGNWDYTAQYNYFAGKTTTAMTKENYSVVRERQGVLRVEGHVGLWQKVNYMVFTNNNFGAKHFYAFINKAEYINPNTTFLYFQIDVMQTWLGELKIENSLIEREHVEDDSLYANLEDEGVEIQERLPYDPSFNFEPYIGQKMLVIGSTENPISVELQASNFKIEYNPYDFTPYSVMPKREWIVKDISEGSVIYTYEGNTGWFKITDSSLESFTFVTTVLGGLGDVYDITAKKVNEASNVWKYHAIKR